MSADDSVPRRLVKRLADGSSLRRPALMEAIGSGRVAVGGVVERDPHRWIFAGDQVSLDERAVVSRRVQHTLLFHKPAEVTATLSETLGRADLRAALAEMPDGCVPVGRLDRATTGAFLFTTDGDLANALLRPEHHVPKLYRLVLDEAVRSEDPRLWELVDGVDTAIGRLRCDEVRVGASRPARVVAKGPPDRGETELWLTLREGKNRQIRRMCRCAGLRLRQLHRAAIGPIALGALPEGRWRALAEDEVAALWRATGGRARLRQRQRAALERQARRARERGTPDLRLEAWLAT